MSATIAPRAPNPDYPSSPPNSPIKKLIPPLIRRDKTCPELGRRPFVARSAEIVSSFSQYPSEYDPGSGTPGRRAEASGLACGSYPTRLALESSQGYLKGQERCWGLPDGVVWAVVLFLLV